MNRSRPKKRFPASQYRRAELQRAWRVKAGFFFFKKEVI
jgi:hypothetical protein